MPPSKAQQDAEAAARLQSNVDPAAQHAAREPSDAHGDPADPGGTPSSQPQAAPPRDRITPEAPLSMRARDEIAARFRADRIQQAETERDDVSDFNQRGGMPSDFEEEAGPAPPLTDQETEPARTVRLKVHGEEIDVPLEDVIADAQKFRASGNLLEEAKTLLKEAKEARNLAGRPGQDGTPAAPQRTQPDPNSHIEQPTTEQPADPLDERFTKLIETMQFGEATEAKPLLRQAIAEEAQRAAELIVQQQLQRDRMRDEAARTAKTVKDFEDQHADLAKDPMARAAIESRIFELQKADLVALGVDLNEFKRPDGSIANTPGEIANAHQFYRAEGFNLKPAATMLREAADDFIAWRGHKTESARPAATPPARANSRVEVTVDRSARQAAIQPQPSRSASPPRQAPLAPPPAQRTDPSSVVAGMMANRQRPRVGRGA